jgi:hypothetical protein
MFNSSYFKNTELAKEFRVSSVTIGRYIEQAKTGSNSLQIINVRGKPRIKRNEYNTNVIKNLTSNEARFKNKGILKQISISDKCYEIFNKKQLLEILSNLEGIKYIPIKYAYLANPSDIWPNHREKSDILLNQKKSLTENLEDQFSYIYKILKDTNSKLNIVQLGSSYNLISKNFVDKFASLGLVNGYVVVDMNEVAIESEVNELTKIIEPNKVRSINYDFERSYCKNYIFEELSTLSTSEYPTINLFLCLGTNLAHYPSYSKIIECLSDISSEDDLLIYDLILRHNEVKYISNFNAGSNKHKFISRIPILLGFDEEDIVVETEYNRETMIRTVYFELKENTELSFDKLYEGKTIKVKLKKGEKISLMRTKLTNFIYDYEMLQRKSYMMVKSTVSTNEKFLTILAKKAKLF